MSERLIVKFEKGTGGPLRTAIGDLVPTYIAPPADVPPADVSDKSVIVFPGEQHRDPVWGLMLSDVACEGEFTGVARWYQIAFSHIITVRPYNGGR